MDRNLSSDTRISLRLADGRLYPILRYGHISHQHLLLIPAHEQQNEVALGFTYHPADGTPPVPLGTLHLTDLPKSEKMELELEVWIDSEGKFFVTADIKNTGQRGTLEMEIPSGQHRGRPRRSRLFWIAGLLFVGASLLLILWVAVQVAHANKSEPQPILSSMSNTNISETEA